MVFLLVLQALRGMEGRQADVLSRQVQRADEQIIRQWIDLVDEPLRRLVQDYGQWDELARFVRAPDRAWAEANLRDNLQAYGAHAVWVLDPHHELLFAAHRQNGPALVLPVEHKPQPSAEPPAFPERFFAESRDGLLEIWAQPIRPAGATAALGWLLVARAWNERHLATLARLTESSLSLAPPVHGLGAGPESFPLQLALHDEAGRLLRFLVARPTKPDLEPGLVGDTLGVQLALAFGLLVLLALWLALRGWVLQPLAQIAQSLAGGGTAPIRPLLGGRDELAQVARLVESSFSQQAALQREIAERRQAEADLRHSEKLVRESLELRARLARDLHDGVIQSIYAAGLGLESAVSMLDRDAAGARSRLQLCRQSLNDVIREVRGFVNGLEPEQMPRQAFAQELTALVNTMQALWPVRIVLEMEPDTARALDAAQEVHALQIVRECISNALRHGNAQEVRITVRRDAGSGVLDVRDDGVGFDPGRVAGDGRGLANLSARAREMGGELHLDSRPGRGTTVTVRFPLHRPPP
ncbi:MAG: hypothetical protein JNG83_04150 [Opitutaceae bacterium]|nr:hypothetical protein [Opitutaceae bacterium]